jgi:hypothetical protein
MALWFHNGLIISLMFLTFNRIHKFDMLFCTPCNNKVTIMENFNTNYVYEHELVIELDDPYNVIHSP